MRFEALLTARTQTRLGTETGTQFKTPAHGENPDAIRRLSPIYSRPEFPAPGQSTRLPVLRSKATSLLIIGVPNLNVRRSTLLPDRARLRSAAGGLSRPEL